MTDEHDEYVGRRRAEPVDHEHPGEHHEGDLLGELGLAEGKKTSRHGRSAMGCFMMLLLLALVLGVGYVAVDRGAGWLKDQFAAPEDYEGQGTGAVMVEVKEGDTSPEIATTLKDLDVVKSRGAFIEEANRRAGEAQAIQVGFYELRKQMSASAALDVLADPKNIKKNAVTIPEGLRVVDVVELLAQHTKLPKAQFEAALKDPAALGLPAYAKGNAEGYLFPATYDFPPNATPADMLKLMVTRWRQAAEKAGLEQSASELGYTPHELMTIASLIEAEGRGDDMPKIARVIYNRLEGPGDKGGTNGRLQIDATVNYALGRKGVAAVTNEDLKVDSPYNTYTNVGLPPGPVEAPGDAAIKAAAQPAEGPWYYYVTVNLATGETKFAEDYQEFLRYKEELREYCRTQSDRC